MARWINFQIKSELQEVVLLTKAIHSVCGYLGITEEHVFRIEISIVEAVTNAIRHAYLLKPDQEISVSLTCNGSRVELEVADRGIPMKPEQVERLRGGSQLLDFDECDIAALPEGGMGLDIIHKSMDEVDYVSTEGQNRCRMVALVTMDQNVEEQWS